MSNLTPTQTPTPPAPTPIGIGVRNEKSLHAALKQWYARPGDQLETKVEGYIIDIVRGELLIEIQTRNLGALRRKLLTLLERHPVRLIYPLAREKWIVRLSKSGRRILGRRKSPKVGRLADLFTELVSLPELINHPNLTLEVVWIQEEEIRREDAQLRRGRRRQHRQDRKLLGVLDTQTFTRKEDFLSFLPVDLPPTFSNRQLAQCRPCSIHAARRITYCLKKMGVLEVIGKDGRQLLFRLGA